LALFPFEAAFYQKHDVPVSFVGHPLADTIPIESQRDAARRELNIPQGQAVVALLPGSRQGEVARMGPVFLQSAGLLSRERPDLRFLLPCANAERKRQLLRMQAEAGIRVDLLDGNSRLAMAAADAVLLASGTAALEALLLKKPMLVCYRMAPLSYAIISRMLRVPYFSLPNLLAGQVLVEELVQDAVNSPALAARMAALLDQDAEVRNRLNEAYLSIHASLRRGASARAADAVLGLTASV
jgi:lipid-A-disaccharide synthase